MTREEEPRAAAGLLARFSALGVRLVPLIAVAGAVMALLLLPDAAALREPYGQLLLVKIALFVLLMGLAALNRLRLVPQVERGEAHALRTLRASMLAEYLLICGAAAVAAVMTGFYSPHDRQPYRGERRMLGEPHGCAFGIDAELVPQPGQVRTHRRIPNLRIESSSVEVPTAASPVRSTRAIGQSTVSPPLAFRMARTASCRPKRL